MNDVVQILEKVQMILLHVKHDCNRRRKAQERVAVFAALRDKAALAADAQRAADRGQIAADHDGRVQPCFHGHQCHHGGRSGLAVRARQTDHIIVIAHQVSPCFCAFHHRDIQRVRADDLGVIVMHGGSTHDQRCAFHIFRLVLIGDLCAERLQPRGYVGL